MWYRLVRGHMAEFRELGLCKGGYDHSVGESHYRPPPSERPTSKDI